MVERYTGIAKVKLSFRNCKSCVYNCDDRPSYKTLYTAQFTAIPYCHFLSDNKVLIVIGGDKYYRDEDEKARSVISRWARRKVSSQFGEEFLDGRQSFIFSWNENHRLIHEEAMYHFLEPLKRGCKFEYTPPKPLPKPVAPVVPQPLPKPEPSAAPWTTGTYTRPEVRIISVSFLPNILFVRTKG